MPFLMLDGNGNVYSNGAKINTVEKVIKISPGFYIGESGGLYELNR